MTKDFKVGSILENSLGEFTKVVAIDHDAESCSITGWTNLKSAEEATVAIATVNSYGLKAAGAKLKGSKAKAETPKKVATVAKKAPAKKVAPKKATK